MGMEATHSPYMMKVKLLLSLKKTPQNRSSAANPNPQKNSTLG